MRFECSLEEYKKYKLGELVENVVAGATPKTSVDDYWNGGDIPWLSSGEVHKKFIYFTDKFITSEGYNNSSTKIVPTNSVLIALAGQGKTRGTVAINKIELCTNQSIASIIPNEMLNYKYLFYYLESKYEYLRALSSSDGGRGGLNLKLIRSIPIQVPSIKEQENISNFINEIDKKILLLEQKHKLYDDFKKYLMQQIFTQKLRFKSADGEQYSDWKERNLYEFLTEHKLKSTGNEEVYSVSVHKGLVNQKEHLGRDFSAPDTSKYNLVKPGDIVYTKSPTGDFPLGIIKQSRVDKNVIVSPLYGVFTPETYALGYILNDYFESNVNTHNYLHPIVQKGAKNTMNITNKTFLSKTLFVPTDVNEQQKIAECFSKVNDSIRNIEIQQNKVNEFKKGLLQQMFIVRINWRCNFKLAKSPSFNKHLLILKNKIIFIIIE